MLAGTRALLKIGVTSVHRSPCARQGYVDVKLLDCRNTNLVYTLNQADPDRWYKKPALQRVFYVYRVAIVARNRAVRFHTLLVQVLQLLCQ